MSFLKQRGKYWHLVDGKKWKSLKTTNEKIANDYWHTYEESKSRLYLGLDSKNVSIHVLVAQYKKLHKADPTISRDALTFRNFFRHCPIETIGEFTDQCVGEFVSKRKSIDHVENSTVNRDLTTLKHFGKMLRRWKYLIRNPLEDLEDLKETQPDTKYFTAEHITKILKNSKGIWHDMFLIAVNTGLRVNELLSLRWNNNIDLKEGRIMIQAPKTKKIRYIPMTEALRAHLGKMQSKAKHDAVICFPDGKQPVMGSITHHWIRLLNQLKIKKPGLSFRNSRHTCATHLLAQGVPIDIIRQILGHSSPILTERYAKMDLRQIQAAMNKIPYGQLP